MSEEEKTALGNIFDDLEAVKLQIARWKGSLAVLLGLQVILIGGVGWGVRKIETMNVKLETALKIQAVSQERWGQFVSQGPRFTREDYAQHIKGDLAEERDWVRQYIDDAVPPPEVEASLDLLEKTQLSLERRITALESNEP